MSQQQPQTAPGLLERFINGMALTLRRIGFHLLAIAASPVIAGLNLPEIFYAYIGLICFIPPGFTLRQDRFRIPALFAALLLAACLLVYQLPGAVALLWAGGVTWLMHVVIRRFSFGWGWLVLPFLLLTFASSLRNYPFPWYAFAACGALGVTVYALATLKRNKTRLDKILANIALLLDVPLSLTTFPEKFDAQFRALQRHCAELLGASTLLKNKYSAILSPRLENLYPNLGPALKWTAENFDSQSANSLLAALAESNTLMEQVLHQEREARLMAGKGPLLPGKASSSADPFAEYASSAALLLNKKAKLPEAMQQHLNALFLSTGSIIACMREDEGDRPSGTRFLNRYLPAVHKTVDEYIRLTGTRPLNDKAALENIKTALAQCESVLERMVQAFQEEHGNLLRNDTMRFTADLNVLDTMLKIDGR